MVAAGRPGRDRIVEPEDLIDVPPAGPGEGPRLCGAQDLRGGQPLGQDDVRLQRLPAEGLPGPAEDVLSVGDGADADMQLLPRRDAGQPGGVLPVIPLLADLAPADLHLIHGRICRRGPVQLHRPPAVGADEEAPLPEPGAPGAEQQGPRRQQGQQQGPSQGPGPQQPLGLDPGPPSGPPPGISPMTISSRDTHLDPCRRRSRRGSVPP